MGKKVISKRRDLLILTEACMGNINGDMNMDNMPRQDDVTGHGLVSDVCLARQMRNYVMLAKTDENGKVEPGFDIYVQPGVTLEEQQKRAYDHLEMEAYKKEDKDGPEKVARANKFMCEAFYDVRMRGAVLNVTSYRGGAITGPIQMTFGRSIDPINPTEHAITRCAYTTVEKSKKTSGENEIGHKWTVPYALYQTQAFVSVPHARRTGATEEDYELFIEALKNMWDHSRSSTRGMVSTRAIFEFEHDSALGNAPSFKLFDRIKIKRKPGVEVPMNFDDYEITVDDSDLPEGVTLKRVL